jgi:hypothetical protein
MKWYYIVGIFLGLVWFTTFFVFLCSAGEAIGGTWNLFFREDDRRMRWSELSMEESTFIGVMLFIFSPIVYPLLIAIALCRMGYETVVGFKKMIFRIRSRKFEELAKKLTDEGAKVDEDINSILNYTDAS